MDMACELGMPVGVLSRVMPLHELHAWHAYAQRRLLPSRRVEIYLAQIALLIAKTMGGARDAKLSDFLIQPPPERRPVIVVDEKQVERLIEAFAFKPRKRK